MLPIVGFTRIRNESTIIVDTLRHMERLCDGLLVYDDCSTDDTVARVEKHSTKLLKLVRGERWSPERTAEETRHRKLLLELAQEYRPRWLFCFDADERFDANTREFLLSRATDGYDAVRIRYYDAYMTESHSRPYQPGAPLAELPRMYGPEHRDILVAWRNSPLFWYEGLDAREPMRGPEARVLFSPLRCKHFGKGISVEQWEETCDYYAQNFPEPYKTKWTLRKGKALHTTSDFGRPLYTWDEVGAHAVSINPFPLPQAQEPVPSGPVAGEPRNQGLWTLLHRLSSGRPRSG